MQHQIQQVLQNKGRQSISAQPCRWEKGEWWEALLPILFLRLQHFVLYSSNHSLPVVSLNTEEQIKSL
jgi:hypothetical protein